MTESGDDELRQRRQQRLTKTIEEVRHARLSRATKALQAFAEEYGPEEDEYMISDLLIDLHHLADHRSIDWEHAISVAEDNYEQESDDVAGL